MPKRKLKFDKNLVSYKKKKVAGKSKNPFDKRFQTVKKKVLGKRIKGTQRKDGESRAKDLKKRKKLFADAQKSKRANTFQDRRYDSNFDRALKEKVTKEKAALVRFQRQRVKMSKKNFSLEDGEEVELTHEGKSLGEGKIDFKLPDNDSDDEDNHFDLEELEKFEPEGFDEIRKRAGLPPAGAPRTQKQAMQEIVLKSRFMKELRKKEKELILEQVGETDTSFMKIREALFDYGGFTNKRDRRREERKDDYDRLVERLQKETLFEGVERSKTDEERAKEEREALEKKEQERQGRQNNIEVGDLDITNWDEIEEKAQAEMKEIAPLPKVKIGEVRDALSMEDIPFVLEVPEDLEEFRSMMAEKTVSEQLEIIQRIRKSNHVRLKAENKPQMQKFYGMLFENFKYLCREDDVSWSDIDVMSRAIFAISHDLPEIAGGIARGNLVKIQASLEDKNKMPAGYLLMYFKLVSNIFPMSDFSHPVSSSLMLVLAFCLSRCRVKSQHEVACGLFICTLLLHSVRETKRYIPEVVDFLQNLLRVGTLPNHEFIGMGFELMKQSTATFWQFEVGSNVWKSLSKKDEDLQIKIDPLLLFHSEIPDQEVALLHSCLELIKEMTNLWKNYPTFEETSNEFLQLLEGLKSRLPSSCELVFKDVCKSLEVNFAKKRQPLFVRMKPKTIPSFEPKYDPEFFPQDFEEKTPEHYRKLIAAEKKKEKDAKKQTMRDLKRSAEFTSRQERELQKDDERRRKAQQKALWAFQEQLQADSNLLDRTKKK